MRLGALRLLSVRFSRSQLAQRADIAKKMSTCGKHDIKAVVWDMGGVLINAPMFAWNKLEAQEGLPKGSVLACLRDQSDGGVVHELFVRMEKGEISAPEFEPQFSRKLYNSLNLDGETKTLPVFSSLGEWAKEEEAMVEAVYEVKARGLKTGLLTNNYYLDPFRTTSALLMNLPLINQFDAIVESCKAGTRKPERHIFDMITDRLGVPPSQTVFLDDIGANVKAARRFGYHTIKVNEIEKAVEELSEMLGFNLCVPGTVPVPKHLEIPLADLCSYLRKSVGLGGPAILRLFRHGQSNPTYYLKIGDEEFVLRKKPPGKLLPSAHMVEREYQVMKAIEAQGVPVPPLICLCEDPSIIGTPFYVMRYVTGRILKEPDLAGFSPEAREEIYRNMNEVLAKIHSVNLFSAGLSDYGKQDKYLERQLSRWGKQYEASKTHEIPSMNKLLDWLPKNIPATASSSLVHGDFRLDNLILHPTENKVLAVLDWELSTLGDPMTDLATASLPYYVPTDFPLLQGLGGLEEELKAMGIPSVEEFTQQYFSRLDQQPLTPEVWAFYMSFIFFRFAAILQGVYKRSLQGQASNPNAQSAGLLAERLADMGWAVVQKGVLNKDSLVMPQFGWFPSTPESLPPKSRKIYDAVKAFVENEVIPKEREVMEHHEGNNCWEPHPAIDQLKEKSKELGLWNLFIPSHLDPTHEHGAGYLNNVEYAHACEQMGRSIFAPEVFNCSAPDTGNMEVLLKYGSPMQKDKFLTPLLEGKVRSCFAMTEPAVASSDATNIQSSIRKEGNEYVLNGHKWYISGAMHPKCEVCIFMGKTDPSAPRHLQQSMIVLPMSTPGITIKRPMAALGSLDPPFGHAEIIFDNVRVPAENLILGEGRGFEIAQGRLGPGRIHHCMRLLGHCERALQLMKERVKSRVAFGKPLAEQGTIRADIAHSRIEIEQARLLVLKAAHVIDVKGNKDAARDIAMIKVAVPNVALRVIDRAIQAHGAMGLSQDTVLSSMYIWARTLRLADGPDEVHTEAIARQELKSKI